MTGGGGVATSPVQALAFLNSRQAPHDVDNAAAAPDAQLHFMPSLPDDALLQKLSPGGVVSAMRKSFPVYGVGVLPTLLRPLSRYARTVLCVTGAVTRDPFACDVSCPAARCDWRPRIRSRRS